MSEGDKQIKFQFTIDHRSLEVAKSGIRQLTSDIKTLVETMSRAGSAGGGLGGSGLFSGMTGRQGGVNPSQQATIKGNTALPVQGIAADARALSMMAKAGTDAIRTMTGGLREGVMGQVQQIERLKLALRDLNGEYARLSKAGLGTGSTSSQIRDVQNQLAGYETMGPVGGMVGPGQRVVNRGGVDMVEGEGAGAPPGGLLSRMRSWVSGAGGSGNGVLKQFGISKATAAAAGAAAAFQYLSSATAEHDIVAANEALQAPTDMFRRRAAMNQSYGQLGLSVRRDVNQGLAFSSLTPTQIRAALGPEAFKALETKAFSSTGNAGTVTDAWGHVKDTAGRWSSAAAGWVAGVDNSQAEAGDQSARQMALQRAMGDLPMEQRQRLVEASQQNLQAQNVKLNAYRAEFQSEYLGRMDLMRQARMSGDYIDPLTGENKGSRAQYMGFGTAWTPGQIGGMRSQIGAEMGGRYMGMAGTMLGYQTGGLGNATGIGGIAAGYGAPSAFMSAIARSSSMYGKGGLVDVSAAGQIGGLYTGNMAAGDFNTSGVAGMQGMLATSALFGGDLRSARGAASGNSAYGAYAGGTTDRFQKAVNVLASTGAAGNLYTQEALRNMSTAQRMDLMRQISEGKITSDDQLPSELRLQGVTIEGLKRYGAGRDRFLFSRYMSSQGTEAVNAAVASQRAGGLSGALSGLSGAALRSKITTLGVAAHEAGLAPSVEAGKNLIAQLAASESPELFKSLRKGGIGDVASKSFEADYKRQQDLDVLDKETSLAGERGNIRKGSSAETKAAGDWLVRMGQDMNASNTRMQQALGELTAAIADAARDIRQGKTFHPRQRVGAK